VGFDDGAVQADTAITVGGGIGLSVQPVAVDGATANIKVAHHNFFAGGLAELVEVVVEGILGKAVADGEYAGYAVAVIGHGACGHYGQQAQKQN
jgi:hypothetical protein